jgi:HSP20 family protein
LVRKAVKKKETVETPIEEEGKIALKPQRDTILSRGFDRMFDDFRRSFDDMMAPFLPTRTWWPMERTWPVRAALCDLIDKGDYYVLNAELPGFGKEDVSIEVNKDTLTFSAEKTVEEEEKNEGEGYLHRERTYSASQRTINFPEEVDPSKAEASMNNGILEIVAPKKEPTPDEKMRKIKLK